MAGCLNWRHRKKDLENIARQRSKWSRSSVDVSLLFSNRHYCSLQIDYGFSYRDSLDSRNKRRMRRMFSDLILSIP